ncbi:TAZ zinc finger-domain-containing protein, partial [Ochromonadaceae sp. CCMP2298]
QQRLLLLNHASQCTEKWCRVSPHCPYMKKLWTHMLQCKDRQCKISHCISSRYVLSHYGRCVNSGCSICPSVR